MDITYKWGVHFVRLNNEEMNYINLEPVKIGRINFIPGQWILGIKSVGKRWLAFDRPVCFQGRFIKDGSINSDMLLISPFKLVPGRWVEGYFNIMNEKIFDLTGPGQGFDIIPTKITIAPNQEFEEYPIKTPCKQLSIFDMT